MSFEELSPNEKRLQKELVSTIDSQQNELEEYKQRVKEARKYERGELIRFIKNCSHSGVWDFDKLREIFDKTDKEAGL